MMSKVILTQEQAESLELALEKANEDKDLMLKWISSALIQEKRLNKKFSSLKKLSVGEVDRALYIGYEVEPEFKVGDWVVRTKELDHQNFHEGKIFKINSVIKSELMKELMVVDADDNSEHLFNNIRHATPEEIAEEKERRWWAKHGREPWELRTDDVLTRNDDGFPWFVDGKRDTLRGKL